MSKNTLCFCVEGGEKSERCRPDRFLPNEKAMSPLSEENGGQGQTDRAHMLNLKIRRHVFYHGFEGKHGQR